MEFEFVEFYPSLDEFSKIIGTAHVYAYSKVDKDVKFDIRGIIVTFKRGHRINVILPHKSQLDPESGEKILFPVLNFFNVSDKKKLIKLVKIEYSKWRKKSKDAKYVEDKVDKLVDFTSVETTTFHNKRKSKIKNNSIFSNNKTSETSDSGND